MRVWPASSLDEGFERRRVEEVDVGSVWEEEGRSREGGGGGGGVEGRQTPCVWKGGKTRRTIRGMLVSEEIREKRKMMAEKMMPC